MTRKSKLKRFVKDLLASPKILGSVVVTTTLTGSFLGSAVAGPIGAFGGAAVGGTVGMKIVPHLADKETRKDIKEINEFYKKAIMKRLRIKKKIKRGKK